MAILRRRIFDTFEISDSLLVESEQQKPTSAANKGDSVYKEAIEIYKMEYESCAQRYNDLYNAAWTNFSYMALVAGGILSFGGARFVTPFTAFLACLPLLFWWLATFEPLNRYGDHVETQILKIEKALNALSISQLKGVAEDAKKGLTHFEDFANLRRGTQKPSKIEYLLLGSVFVLLLLLSLSTFLNIQVRALSITLTAILIAFTLIELIFKERRRQGIKLVTREYPRVRFRVRIAAFVLLITVICFGIKVAQMLKAHEPLTVPISMTSEH